MPSTAISSPWKVVETNGVASLQASLNDEISNQGYRVHQIIHVVGLQFVVIYKLIGT